MEQNRENSKLYDLTTIYAISDDNPQFLEKLLLVFSDTISKDVQAIKAAAGENNWAEVGQLAHKLKPSAAHFGITSLKDTIRSLEHPNGLDTAKLNVLVTQLESTISSVLSGLKAEFPAIFTQ